jgi:ABC-type lipoprotein export system ATPase subunit
MSLLEIENIDVYYGDVQVIFGLSLKVENGSVVSIIGTNGAGKSTTLKTISSLLIPKKGQITFNGDIISILKSNEVVEKGVIHIPEGRRLFPFMTIMENLQVGAFPKRAQGKEDENLRLVFALFPLLSERSNKLANTLSGGEQQMLAIGRALMSNPLLIRWRKKMAEQTERLLKRRAANVPKGVFNITPLFVKRAHGAVLVDVDGKEYIDFAGGIGVENVGHCADAVVRAIKDQADAYIHTCFHVVMYEPYVELAEKLNKITPGDFDKMTMFANSGAEAVENGVKIARYWTERPAIIALDYAFHGRTMMAMSLTGKIMPYKYKFGPFAPEVYRIPAPYCYRCPFNLQYPSCALACAEYLEDYFISTVAADSVAAIIIEPVIGEGGFIVPPNGYLKRVKEICGKYGRYRVEWGEQARCMRASIMGWLAISR